MSSVNVPEEGKMNISNHTIGGWDVRAPDGERLAAFFGPSAESRARTWAAMHSPGTGEYATLAVRVAAILVGRRREDTSMTDIAREVLAFLTHPTPTDRERQENSVNDGSFRDSLARGAADHAAGRVQPTHSTPSPPPEVKAGEGVGEGWLPPGMRAIDPTLVTAMVNVGGIRSRDSQWRTALRAAECAREKAEARACHHGWRGAAPERGERIVTPCPSCGCQSLFIGSGGHLTCARVPSDHSDGCHEPGVAEAVEKLKARAESAERERDEAKAHRDSSFLAHARERDAAITDRDAARREVGELRAVIAKHDLCHNLHGKVDARAFADGCAAEQRKLYGCAPDADELAALRQRLRDPEGVPGLIPALTTAAGWEGYNAAPRNLRHILRTFADFQPAAGQGRGEEAKPTDESLAESWHRGFDARLKAVESLRCDRTARNVDEWIDGILKRLDGQESTMRGALLRMDRHTDRLDALERSRPAAEGS